MLGRGTRLCPDLFGPGLHKEFFYIFDYCQNFEYFSQNPEGSAGSVIESLSAKLLKARLELVGELDASHQDAAVQEVYLYDADPRSDRHV